MSFTRPGHWVLIKIKKKKCMGFYQTPIHVTGFLYNQKAAAFGGSQRWRHSLAFAPGGVRRFHALQLGVSCRPGRRACASKERRVMVSSKGGMFEVVSKGNTRKATHFGGSKSCLETDKRLEFTFEPLFLWVHRGFPKLVAIDLDLSICIGWREPGTSKPWTGQTHDSRHAALA